MAVSKIRIDADQAGQRVDNFLFKRLKGVPKSRIYRALRKGEVRVNGKRLQSTYRLVEGDELRIPPLRIAKEQPVTLNEQWRSQLEQQIIFEDNTLLVINKPSGLPVHGGSGIHSGLIERLRLLRPQQKFLELVHRLDRETSGCLLIAKKRSRLLELHQQMTDRKIDKRYWALVQGQWPASLKKINQPLEKNHLSSGERIVKVSPEGKPSVTYARVLATLELGAEKASWMEMILGTGRSHQIRVHAQHVGHPLAGDQKYGSREFNQCVHQNGVNRLFLHAFQLQCTLDGEPHCFRASLPTALRSFLESQIGQAKLEEIAQGNGSRD